MFPGTQDWAVRILENIVTHPLVTGDECPHCEWSFCSLKSLWWVWPAWIPSWEPGHCSCTDKVSFGDYTAVKSHLSKMMDVITKGMEIPESQAGIPRYSATDSPSVHWSIFPEQQAFWKVVNFWAHLRTRVNKAVNPGKCPSAFTKLSDKTAKYLLYLGAPTEEKKGLDFNLNILACQYHFLASSNVFQVSCP